MNRLLAVLICGAVLASAAERRPNIVILLADDMAWTDAGCYGNADVRTPNIDRVAKEGLKFTHAFTATAMCAPTRQQLYSGLFPVRSGAYPNHSKVKPGTRSMVHHLRELGYRVGLKGKKHFGPQASFPFDVVKDVRAYMEADEKPFCLVFASNYPHPAWPEIDGYDPGSIKVPPHLVDNPETRAALCRYYTAVSKFDDEVGQYLKLLEEAGQSDNTIFIVSSEQGPDFPGGKWTCYDYGLRTQFLVRWPDAVRPGRVTDAMIQYVDVLPTIIELAGGKPDEIDAGRPGAPGGGRGFDGRSFAGVIRGASDSHGEFAFGVHTTQGIIAGKPYPVRSVRNRRYKLIMNLMSDATFQNIMTEKNYEQIWNSWVRDAQTCETAARLTRRYQHRPAEEFYDLQADPFEQRNLADDPAHRERIDRMKAVLESWMSQQGDRGIETELAVPAHRSMR